VVSATKKYETYEVERYRLENVKESLQSENLSAIIASSNYLRTQINNWAALLPIEKKRLLRLALKAAWVREHISWLFNRLSPFCPFSGVK